MKLSNLADGRQYVAVETAQAAPTTLDITRDDRVVDGAEAVFHGTVSRMREVKDLRALSEYIISESVKILDTLVDVYDVREGRDSYLVAIVDEWM
jgi:hypothetical protein